MTRKGAEITMRVKSTLDKSGRKQAFADKRTANPAGSEPRQSVKKPRGQEQDVKRRLGDFSGAGEHPRQTTRITSKFARSKKANTGTKRV